MASVQVMVAAVPTANKTAYLDHAQAAAALFRKHGALSVAENWGQDVPDGELTSFPMAVRCQPGETVVVSWISWPDRTTQDKAWEAMMPEMQAMGGLPFDGKRMIFGTFETILEA
ncbi:MAG TPA: DUF1428 domain-containing protein [Hyphomonas sp.]|nr:DUF1428 domain-containing protein [Hyphomonas sp.]MCA8904588.1 DUF1428 domain-containing protein [Hyphomonas sp.]MCB9972185.1 DUF1428 domain-containing protein [Hyphomonas sp.]HPE49649.1 DUF1428 domain-containing protein [Hyphomonas sp.]